MVEYDKGGDGGLIMAHTPGPWEVVLGVSTHVRDCSNGDTVATMSDRYGGQWLDYSVVKANARLIAAAPEMMEALEAFAQAEKTHPWPDDKILIGYDGWSLTVGMVRAARAALVKAKGE